MKTVHVALVLLLAAAISYATVKLTASNATQQHKESVYERVMRTGTIRCGYMLYPGQFEKDPNTGKISGLMVDILSEVGKGLGLTVEYTEEVGTVNMIPGLDAGRYDMICNGAWTNLQRARAVRFSVPMYFSVIKGVVREDDNRFDNNLNAISNPNVKISAVDGSTPAHIAHERFPDASFLENPELTDYTQSFTDVLTGKADVTVIDNYLVKDYLAKNPGKLREIPSAIPVQSFANVLIYQKDDAVFATMMDTALNHLLYNGVIDNLLEKHEKYPNSFYRVIKPFKAE